MNHVELVYQVSMPPAECSRIEEFALFVLERLGTSDWNMSLVVTDDEGIREYNRSWRNMDKATDVLSFVQDEGVEIPQVSGMPKEAGDVIVSLETVQRNATEWGNPFDEELRRVIIHGILHLKGLDHPGDDYRTGMLKIQEELLSDSGSLLNRKL